MDKFRALANSEHGKWLKEYFKDLIRDVTDVRTIEEITETEVIARKRVAEILEENFLDKLSLEDRIVKENETSDWE